MTEHFTTTVAPRKFTLNEARVLLPTVKQITAEAAKDLKTLSEEGSGNEATDTAIQQAAQTVIQDWVRKIATLGCVPNGVWLVDFDNGAGYFCWQHGEEELGYYHPYEAGFAGRTPIN